MVVITTEGRKHFLDKDITANNIRLFVSDYKTYGESKRPT